MRPAIRWRVGFVAALAGAVLFTTPYGLRAQASVPASRAPASAKTAVEIAKGGVAAAEIVVPDKAGPAERYAAQELADYLSRISGVSFGIALESQATNRSRLLVGKTRAAERLLADLQREDVDAFAVRQMGGDVVLVGASERATVYAVYDLLERELGCRWLAPGPAWEELPKRDRVTLSPVNRIERPALKYRYERMTYLPTTGPWEKECLKWAVRRRINMGYEWPATPEAGKTLVSYGGFRGFMWPHSLPFLTDLSKLSNEHPDWFALVNGKRSTHTVPKNVNLCTSNPEVIAFVAGVMSAAFEAQPQAEILPLGPGDGTAFCHCEGCRALDTGGTWSHSDGVAQPALGDRWLTFVNAVADRLAVSHPGKKLYTIAYHQTFQPPLKVKPQPNVMVMVVNSRPEGVCFVHAVETPDCPNNALFCRNFKAWSAIAPAGMLAYQYMPHSTFCNMPLPAPQKFVADIRWLAQHGCVGYEGQSGIETFGLFGITLYATAKAMWNPSLDADSLTKDYCDSAFHEAGGAMQSFFQSFQAAQRQAAHTSTGIWTSLAPDSLAKARTHLEKARASAREETVRRRLNALAAHLAYAEDGCRIYNLAQKAIQERDLQLLDEATALARQAENKLNEAQKADPACLNLSLPARQLDLVLRPARAALKTSARKSGGSTGAGQPPR